MSSSATARLAARILGGVFGIAFGGIGLAMLAFMWGFLGDDGFGGPPLFFRIFASLIALPFVAVGGAALIAAFAGKSMGSAGTGLVAGATTALHSDASKPAGAGCYQCPQCSSPLAERADVSPHGNAKCGHCGAWFNVHS